MYIPQSERSLDPYFKKVKCDKNCIFNFKNLSSNNSDLFPKSCKTVCGELRILEDCDLSEKQLSELFKNMKNLWGGLKIVGTNFTNLNFLENLETIECEEFRDFQCDENTKIHDLGGLKNLSSIACMEISIWNNSKMKFLDFPKLKTIKYPKNVYTNKNLKFFAFDLDPEFCTNSKEMEFFMNNRKLELELFEGKYCQPPELDSEICQIPEDQCKTFLGDLEIGPEFVELSKLKNIEVILGNLIINGTKLENFEFFENLKFVASLDKSQPPILIENNFNLKDIQFPKLEVFFVKKKINSKNKNVLQRVGIKEKVIFSNNSELISTKPKFCNKFKKSLKWQFDELLIDGNECVTQCMFPTQNLTARILDSIKICQILCANLEINEFFDLPESDQLNLAFKHVKRIVGDDSEIMIFGNSKMIEIGLTSLKSISCAGLQISNPKMKKLNIPNLQNLTSINPNSTKFEIYISSESPEFCITIQEMEILLKIDNSDIDHIFGKYCKTEFTDSLCKNPEEECTAIFGDLTISKYSDLNHLKFLEIIYGSLNIKETNFKNLNFLKNLKFVAQMDRKSFVWKPENLKFSDKPAIIIQDNPNLVNVTFPSLKRIRSETTESMVFKKNNSTISGSSEICFQLRNSLKLSEMAPIFDDNSCEQLKTKSQGAGEAKYWIFLIISPDDGIVGIL
ncbi:Protein CBG01141 [Caenorhabditis briggsae]|uniref:Protein CBG01141 n=1 Tax=Caenorhabditis briggsae TaxID=6238 RepID=A8WPN5_CAEBR|nr:Protein CBG01141 [Caenorhabditis briggsae]CAP22442.2 Protein CBG01141 [Caenorhabditis briggsae]